MTPSQQPWQLTRPDIPEPTDTERVQHMVQAIDRLKEITGSYTAEELLAREVPQSAGCHSFGIVAEAAAGTSVTFRKSHPFVNWERWKRYGRQLVRDYYRVNYRRLWERWQPETLPLRQQLVAILAQEQAAHV